MVSVRGFVAGLLAGVVCCAVAAGCGRSAQRTKAALDALYTDSVEALRKGDLGRARSLAVRGIGESENLTPPGSGTRFALLEAEVLLFGRAADEAATRLDPDLPASAGGALRARRRYLQGQLHLVRGQLDEAVEALAEAGRMARAISAVDVSLDAAVLEGQVLVRLRRWADAESRLQAAWLEADRAGDRYRQIVALHNLGMARLVRNRFDEAAPYFDRVLAFRDLDAYTVYATALTNAAICYARLGEFEQAITAFQRAIDTHERLGARVYLEQALGELGSTYVLRGDYGQSITYLTRALEMARQVRQDADAGLWAANLASAYLEQGRWAEARRFNDEAMTLRGDARNLPYLVLFDARILEGQGKSGEAERRYREAAARGRDDPNVQWRVSARLGWMAHAAGHPGEASKHFDAALAVVERTRSDLLKQEDRLSIQTRLVDLYYQYADVLVRDRQTERALSVLDSGRAAELAERSGGQMAARMSPAEFRRLAGTLRAVLLFYWFGEAHSYAWVVSADAIHMVTLPASEQQIDALIREYRQLVVDSIGNPLVRVSAGDRLYDSLVMPLARWIPAGSRIVVVPDGALSTLNFESLPVPGDRRHYWIEDVEIAVAPSLGALNAAASGATSDRPALLIGDAVQADPRYPVLQYASTEMGAIEAAFKGRALVYSGEKASPDAYRAAHPERFGIVHFTAHATANAESPLDSAVILSDGASGYKLYARDVAELPLSADLVTISACRSAGERTYAGEGLVGFAWAFLRAGANRVIAGLWDVDDRSTADLMARLYTGIARGESPGAALRAAKLAMLAQGGVETKPYYWAPFQLFVGAAEVP